MSIRSFFARQIMKVAAVAVLTACAGSVSAADVTPPVTYPAAPVTVGAMPGCESCQHGIPAASCTTCGKATFGRGWMAHKQKPPFQVNLCPGACFGYFQTQWRKWDEVCPYPYLGHGVSDAGRLPGTVPPRPGTQLMPPRPVDPTKMKDPKQPGSDLPPIPSGPGKFSP